jgi:hypothetical protein
VTVSELISELEKYKKHALGIGFKNPQAFGGIAGRLVVEPAVAVDVISMIKELKGAIGVEFTLGEHKFTATGDTFVLLAEPNDDGIILSEAIWEAMLSTHN